MINLFKIFYGKNAAVCELVDCEKLITNLKYGKPHKGFYFKFIN